MKLTLIRHGQTVENVNQIIQGNLDGTLSELGIQQSKNLAQKLKDENFNQVWSSDLGRCVITAKYIMEFHPKLDLQLSSSIRELNFGTHQGKYSRSVDWDSLEGTILTRRFPGGESVLEMQDRVVDFINNLRMQFPNQNILLVTHGGPIRIVRSVIEKLPLELLYDLEIANTSIWRFNVKMI